MKKLQVILLVIVLSTVLSGCVEAGISRAMMLLKKDSYTCETITLSARTGKPMAEIALTNVPEKLDEVLTMEVVDVKNNKSAVFSPVFRSTAQASEATFIVPVHPSATIEGGKANITLTDGKVRCELETFEILAMPESPGAFAELVDLIDQVNKEQYRILTGNTQPMAISEVVEPSIVEMGPGIVEEAIRGKGNENSLENMADGSAPDTQSIPPEQRQVIDSVIQESGLIEALKDVQEQLQGENTLVDDLEESQVGGSSQNQQNATCRTPLHQPSAQALSRMMEMQKIGEKIGEYDDVMDAASTVLTTATVVSTATGVGSAAAPFLGQMGLAVYATQTIGGMLDGLLPGEMTRITSQFHPTTFKEDDEKITGEWQETLLTTQSKGFEIGKALMSGILKVAGMKGGAQFKSLEKFNLGKVKMTKTANAVMGSYINMIIGEATNGADFLKLPPCEFGPTDITSSEWSHAYVIDKEGAPIKIINHDRTGGSYEGYDIGLSTIVIEPIMEKFAGHSISEETDITIPAIEVKIDPASLHAGAGDQVKFIANVYHANDKSVTWTIEPLGGHTFQEFVDADGNPYILVQTSANESDFPAIVRATSTASGGLRALPNAPPRFGEAMLGGTYADIIVTPGKTCLKPGETENFEAEVYGTEKQEVIWEADGGRISKNGQFTAPQEKGEFTITATSVVDSSGIGTATVTVGNCSCENEMTLVQVEPAMGKKTYFWDVENPPKSHAEPIAGVQFKFENLGARIIREDLFTPEHEDDFADERFGLLDGPIGGLYFGMSNEAIGSRLLIFVNFPVNGGPILGEVGAYNATMEINYFPRLYGWTDDTEKFNLKDQPVTVYIDRLEQLEEPHEAFVQGRIVGDISTTYSKGDPSGENNGVLIDTNSLPVSFSLSFEGEYKYPLPYEYRVPNMRSIDERYYATGQDSAKRPSRMIACKDE